MSVFSRLFAPKETDSARFERLEAKVRSIEINVQAVEQEHARQLKSIELEWEETYDKLKHLMARITKRKAAADRENEQEQAQEGPGATNGRQAGESPSPALGTHQTLSAMRGRLFGGGR